MRGAEHLYLRQNPWHRGCRRVVASSLCRVICWCWWWWADCHVQQGCGAAGPHPIPGCGQRTERLRTGAASHRQAHYECPFAERGVSYIGRGNRVLVPRSWFHDAVCINVLNVIFMSVWDWAGGQPAHVHQLEPHPRRLLQPHQPRRGESKQPHIHFSVFMPVRGEYQIRQPADGY